MVWPQRLSPGRTFAFSRRAAVIILKTGCVAQRSRLAPAQATGLIELKVLAIFYLPLKTCPGRWVFFLATDNPFAVFKEAPDSSVAYLHS
jgi:hypothetical protein